MRTLFKQLGCQSSANRSAVLILSYRSEKVRRRKITRNSAPTFYPAQHQKGTRNQRLTYPSDRPRSSIGLAGLLQPLLLSAVTDNHSLVVACLSLLTVYLLFLDYYPLFVISCDLPLATCHLRLATCHLPLATCHLPLATWFSVR